MPAILFIFTVNCSIGSMPVPNLQNKKVLVVEDDDTSFMYLSHLLTIAGTQFVREKTGTEAIRQFSDHSDFDIVLMDIQLPDLDGIEVTERLLSMRHDVAIIAQTASRSVPELDQMLKAGCKAVLIKPFTMEQLFREMEKILVQR
jgi:CheY-like chemotaxis protein